MMQIGVRNETHCQGENLMYLCFSECRLHTAEVFRVTKLLRVLDEGKTPFITRKRGVRQGHKTYLVS